MSDHPDIEVTVGVEVRMSWDTDSGQYVVTGMSPTDGGLFTDAVEGVWIPETDEWSGAEPYVDAHTTADAAVARIIAN